MPTSYLTRLFRPRKGHLWRFAPTVTPLEGRQLLSHVDGAPFPLRPPDPPLTYVVESDPAGNGSQTWVTPDGFGIWDFYFSKFDASGNRFSYGYDYPYDLKVYFTLGGDAQVGSDYVVPTTSYQSYDSGSGTGYFTILAGQETGSLEIDQIDDRVSDGSQPNILGTVTVTTGPDQGQADNVTYLLSTDLPPPPTITQSQLQQLQTVGCAVIGRDTKTIRQAGAPALTLVTPPANETDRFYNFLATEWNQQLIPWPFIGQEPQPGDPPRGRQVIAVPYRIVAQTQNPYWYDTFINETFNGIYVIPFASDPDHGGAQGQTYASYTSIDWVGISMQKAWDIYWDP